MFNIVVSVQIATVLALFIVLVYTLLQKPSKTQIQMVFIIVSTMLMMIGYIIELEATTEQSALIGTIVSYLGKPFTMLSSLLFMLNYCGHTVKKSTVAVALVYFSSFSIIVATNSLTHWFYKDIEFDISLPFTPLRMGRGVAYYFYMATVIAYMIVCLVLTVREFRRSDDKATRTRVMFFFGVVASGVAGYIVYLTGITGGYDSTMAGCCIGVALLIVLFTKYKIFDVLTLAREQALQDISTGLLVLDTTGKTVYTNETMKKLLDNVLSGSDITADGEEKSIIKSGDKVYSLVRKKVIAKGHDYGTMIEVTDITDSYYYSERLRHDVDERTKEIQHIQRSVIGGFANIVEARDGDTGSHIKRTGEYVRILAEDLKNNGYFSDILTDNYISILVDVSPLHDIGKIGISDTILLKPGRLTDEEFETIKTHTTKGVNVIESTMSGIESDEYVEMAKAVAGGHHEKWNGNGYPGGIAGHDIPLCARIMAVADVYDAIRSERCYKKAMTKEESKNVILEGKGNHFDPAVVDAFIRSIDLIEAV